MKGRSPNQELRSAHGQDALFPMNMNNVEAQRILSSIVDTSQWNRAESEREHVIIEARACEQEGIEVSQYNLARFFGIERSTVQFHIKQGIDLVNPRPVGRPSSLDEFEKRVSSVGF